MITKELLISAIRDYENGGLQNRDFLQKAHKIYNSFAAYPCSLPDAEHPYLLGIIFSAFAKYYADNIDYYTSIMENALFCYSNVIRKSESCSERQCAAIRTLLLIDDNEWVMKGIAHTFYEKKCMQLYGQPLMMQNILAQGMERWTFEIDILKNIGSYCIELSSSDDKHSFISATEMKCFNYIMRSGKYEVEWPLVSIPAERVFYLFTEFLGEFIRTPYERRITSLRYGW